VDGEHVGFLHGARIDALLRLDRGQRRETVAVKCRGFKSGELSALTALSIFACQYRLLHQRDPAAAGPRLAHSQELPAKIDLAVKARTARF